MLHRMVPKELRRRAQARREAAELTRAGPSRSAFATAAEEDFAGEALHGLSGSRFHLLPAAQRPCPCRQPNTCLWSLTLQLAGNRCYHLIKLVPASPPCRRAGAAVARLRRGDRAGAALGRARQRAPHWLAFPQHAAAAPAGGPASYPSATSKPASDFQRLPCSVNRQQTARSPSLKVPWLSCNLSCRSAKADG